MDIDALLEEARSRATNYGKLYGAKETADDYLKLKYAELYDHAPEGTVPAIDAWIRRQSGYKDALERKMEAYADWKAAETYMKLLLVEAEVWRTKCANDRNMDRAHR
jgi:hypothetical protein